MPITTSESERERRPQLRKTYYYPIEVAIRWSGLLTEEQIIINSYKHNRQHNHKIPEWEEFYTKLEQIYDGLMNGELAYGKFGQKDVYMNIYDPALSIRHVDLKAWMSKFYPYDRPEFLFDPLERQLFPPTSGFNVESLQLLFLERESLKTQVDKHKEAIKELSYKLENPTFKDKLNSKSENTYLTIIGALLDLLHTPAKNQIQHYKTLDSVIDAILTRYPRIYGLSERNLKGKFAQAKRHLTSEL
ncbi:hypothetical protein [Zophobihabitans entericus]|uniref:Uncharacterized protein n=1 Tax=Zophobihabitans entericus TaxID=1635327 RepID=A0A6G9ID10_9GAMM|nr:hypothetical protein [Zophobihabitans entericus]QIQ22121.1 hypothetical protein IPMB12_10760 [Zophobihabitans entericus]